MNAYDLIMALVFIVLFIVREVFIIRERTQLLNRLMARDYKDYRYFEDKWHGDLKEVEKVREEAREERKTDEEETAKVDLTQFEEPWEDEDGK